MSSLLEKYQKPILIVMQKDEYHNALNALHSSKTILENLANAYCIGGGRIFSAFSEVTKIDKQFFQGEFAMHCEEHQTKNRFAIHYKNYVKLNVREIFLEDNRYCVGEIKSQRYYPIDDTKSFFTVFTRTIRMGKYIIRIKHL